MSQRPRGAVAVWRLLLLAQFREQPVRLALTVFAIALGVALGRRGLFGERGRAQRIRSGHQTLGGEADIVVRGPREGFPEKVFTDLANNASVSVASPVLELEVALENRSETLKSARAGSAARGGPAASHHR